MPTLRPVVKVEPRKDGYVAKLECGHEVTLDAKQWRELRKRFGNRYEPELRCPECGPEAA